MNATAAESQEDDTRQAEKRAAFSWRNNESAVHTGTMGYNDSRRQENH